MLNIVLFGPPGAGKGTQSTKLVERYKLIHLSTGDLLRGEIAAGTILGQEAKILMDQGMLVPDDIVITMINNKLDKNAGAKGFIFDGFPRTTAQAQALDRLLANKGTGITLTLALEVSTEELTKRILQRGLESGRTDDIDEKTIRNRVNEYMNKTAPLKSYYTSQRKFHSVNGIGTVDDIFRELCRNVDSVYISEFAGMHDSPGQPMMQAAAYAAVSPVKTAVHTDTIEDEKEENEKPVSLTVAKKISKPAAAKKAPVKKKAAKKKPVKKAVKKQAKKKAAVKKSARPAKKLSKKKPVKKNPIASKKKKAGKKKSR